MNTEWDKEAYSPEFYALIAHGSKVSSRVVLPLVLKSMPGISRVLDVGCGDGGWLASAAEFINKKVTGGNTAYTVGMDGHSTKPPGVDNYIQSELVQPGSVVHASLYDLVICLEVAEHLPEDRAQSFVSELCQMSDVVLFSAAIPSQGGVGHVNEQWSQYWVSKFESEGYQCSGALRYAMWDDENVENWYRQNVIMAVNARYVDNYPDWFETPLARVLDVVHPVLYLDKIRIIKELQR